MPLHVWCNENLSLDDQRLLWTNLQNLPSHQSCWGRNQLEMSIWREENSFIAALHISAPAGRSGSVRSANISTHISSPLQYRENIASLADDVISVLSSIQIEKYLHEDKSCVNCLVSLSILSIRSLTVFRFRDKSLNAHQSQLTKCFAQVRNKGGWGSAEKNFPPGKMCWT